jgi:para-aminobenzoate synthetase component 1
MSLFFASSDNSVQLHIPLCSEWNKFIPVEEQKIQLALIPYDVKNQFENLYSNNFDGLNWQDKITLVDVFKTSYSESNNLTHTPINKIKARESKSSYIKKVNALKHHIQQGDIYEVNFCIEFFAEDVRINPYLLYEKLIGLSPMPFSCFVKNNNNYLICASPERFLKKTNNELISQPIKGTIKRGANKEEDNYLIEQLKNSSKEKSENVMIVDLVRNDLSRIAEKGSVKVKELFGIYSFPQWHQMISTISCTIKPNLTFEEILKATFPMGSMTGAPKISAMKLIEEFEETKRGMYSGSVGIMLPNGDFDLNVVIRSIQYNAEKSYLSFMVGSAITIHSDAEKEYDECMLKAKAILSVLDNPQILN